MGSFNDWDDDQDSLYDWGSQFGGHSGATKPSNNNVVVVEKERKKEQLPKDPVPAQENDVATPPTETVVPSPDEPKPNEKPLKKDVWEKMASQQQECAELSQQNCERFRQILSLCEESKLPKGTRAIINHLGHLSDTATATRALVDFYLETNETQIIHAIEESKLKKRAFDTYRMIQSYKTDLKEALDHFEESVRQGEDRHILNLSTRDIKSVTKYLESDAERQAKAYSDALDAYSPAQGTLAMLERFANKGNRELMDNIDNTLIFAGTDMVLTEDAPAMLKALERNDTDAIIRLQQKLIDHLFEKK